MPPFTPFSILIQNPSTSVAIMSRNSFDGNPGSSGTNRTSSDRARIPFDEAHYSDVPNVYQMPLGDSLAIYQIYNHQGRRSIVDGVMRSDNKMENYLIEDIQDAFRLTKHPVPDSKVLFRAKDEVMALNSGVSKLVDTQAWKTWIGDRTVDLEALVPHKQPHNGV